ncbi:proteasome assembly chaperone family protein [Candidatus Micrarchaeota archaeon]|nr:proteasome assembly chaperone family protein [Candidatus Micrarchaeota archaeon]MBI5176893.1 proteasome assembly chaperone family protein [Candidatus Micrarchaeota archaeon]
MHVEIKEIEPVKLKNPVIIEGFPGIGMIGTISSSFLAEKLDMKLIGYFSSPHFPPIAAIHDFKPVSPARIYASEKHNLIVLFSEFVIPANIVFTLTEAITDYARKNKAAMIYSLAGVASGTPDDKIYGIASTAEIGEKLKKEGIELIKEGATQGVSGVLIAECAAEKFPAANLMVQTANPLDPKAAARLLDKVTTMLSLPVKTQELIGEGDKIEGRIKDAMEKMRSMHQDYKTMEENPMYS